MRYSVETRWGGSEDAPSVERMRAILAELDVRDDEHPDTWLISDSGWTLTAGQDGRVVLENDESDGPPRHMRGVSRERVLELWRRLAAGMLEDLEREPWQPGYGTLPNHSRTASRDRTGGARSPAAVL